MTGAAGWMWARLVMQDIPEGGDIAITDCCFGHFALEERNRSFQETLEQEGQGKWKVREIINTTGEEEKVCAAIESYYNANKDIKGIYGVDSIVGSSLSSSSAILTWRPATWKA